MSALFHSKSVTHGRAAMEACERKAPIGSWSQARRVAHRVNQNGRDTSDIITIRPYRCKTCGAIHLGGQPKSATARRRADGDDLDLIELRRIRTLADAIEQECDDA